MSKFVIECPNCGKFAEAKTGFFARKRIDCACGFVINVRTDKLTSRKCAHCGNDVVFDQSRGDKAKCPVCHELINELSDKTKVEEFSCAQCGVKLIAAKNAKTYTCPVCDCVNDVQKQIIQERIKHDGLASIIKYEGDNETLVWKHPVEDFNLGSQLIVHESQEAIFFRDGQALDLFGSGRYTLETQQLPILEKIYTLPTDTDGTFHSEVYYINLTTQMGIKWGTDSKVRMFDPASGMYIEIGASGEFNIRVTNSRKLLMKLVGTAKGMKQEDIFGGKGSKGYFRSMIMTRVKSYLAQTIKDNGYNILEIDYHLQELSDSLQERINAEIAEYGLTMPGFFVNSVMTPDDDPNFRRMKQQYADQYLRVREEEIKRKEVEAAAERKYTEAQAAAKLKQIDALGNAEVAKIKAQTEAEQMRIIAAAEADKTRLTGYADADVYRRQAESEAIEMKMKGYTYQQETARQVGLEAMQNGITGEGYGGGAAVGGLGDIAGLGVTLGAMGGVMNMTREAISPMLDTTCQIGQNVVSNASDTWDCSCGNKGIKGVFCNMCGAQRPQPQPDGTWDCTCGNKGIVGMFCNMCGSPKPEEKKETWDCSCGNRNITGRFCNMCGSPKPEEKKETWDCTCGNKNITGMFCSNCGRRKDD